MASKAFKKALKTAGARQQRKGSPSWHNTTHSIRLRSMNSGLKRSPVKYSASQSSQDKLAPRRPGQLTHTVLIRERGHDRSGEVPGEVVPKERKVLEATAGGRVLGGKVGKVRLPLQDQHSTSCCPQPSPLTLHRTRNETNWSLVPSSSILASCTETVVLGTSLRETSGARFEVATTEGGASEVDAKG